MSWIRSSYLVFSLLAAVCFGDRIEFISGAEPRATLRVAPLASNEAVAPVEGVFTLPFLDRTAILDGFTEISAPGLASIGQVGRPSLPTTGTLIAVPEGYRPEIKIIEKQETTISQTWVAPYQVKTRCDCNRAKAFKFDTSIYENDSLFPNEFVSLQNVGSLQSLKFVRVAINPIQFHPKDKSLTVIYRLKFKVEFIKDFESIGHSLPKTLFGLAQNWASNGKALGGSVSPNSHQEKMLIVSPKIYQQALGAFINWKIQKGLSVEWISFEDAGGTKEALKDYIQNYYDAQKVKPTYLLLVGNADSLPPFMEETTSAGEEQVAASDYPYSLLSGSDPIPDILYGRLLADNEEEVVTQTSRWIEYEKNPERDSWYANGVVIASEEKGADLSDKEYVSEIATNLKKYSYEKIDEFFQGEQTATAGNILSAVSSGRSWITYMGHGSGLGWASTNDQFDVSSVATLSNNRLPFILDISCANADYIHHNKPFAKAWVTHKSGNSNAGAVAYYGGSVNISWDPPAIMAVGISKAHFEKPVHTLGGTVLAGQVYLSEQKGTGDELLDNLRWYQLFGDPSLELRTAKPNSISVTQSQKRNGKGTALTIRIKNESSEPVNGVLVSLFSSQENRNIAVGRSNNQGEVTLKLKSDESLSGELLTLSGYNIETLVTRVE